MTVAGEELLSLAHFTVYPSLLQSLLARIRLNNHNCEFGCGANTIVMHSHLVLLAQATSPNIPKQ